MKEKELNFEELMQKLESITNKLEKESLSLDESVKLFEEAILLDTDNLEEENFVPDSE